MKAKENISPSKLHFFRKPVAHLGFPEKFTYPFHYTPHPVCIMAAEEVQAYLNEQTAWQDELKQGKMFGVLVVRNESGETGFLAAFSGILAGQNLHPFFVPPVYDLQQPDGFFRAEEATISAINLRISQLESEAGYIECKRTLAQEKLLAEKALAEARAQIQDAKKIRDERRHQQTDENETARMIRESQHEKAAFKRLKQQWEQRISAQQASTDAYTSEIGKLKNERKNRSAALQEKLFEQFNLLNARGEARDLCDIFKETVQHTPPAGAGECAAPKLLQYAYLNRLRPLAMAEFWWGESPRGEIRRHGYYYPACKGKCGPILNHMLQGLVVDANPLEEQPGQPAALEILFEDEWLLVVNKPDGMLSVPGKSTQPSVYQMVRNLYPEASGPIIVHRLDMATSGVLLLAKTKEVHQHLQAQFKNHQIKKCYIALLDGLVGPDAGMIDLPLCLNPADRPRQMVNYEHGKTAITRYQVLGRSNNHTRIAFYPETGRTHQLRVHSAHPLGLNTPIIGDELYGRRAQRLCLHAIQIEFRHPVTGKMICVKKEGEF